MPDSQMSLWRKNKAFLEKEVKKIVDYIKAQREKLLLDQEVEFSDNHLAEDLKKSLEIKESESFDGYVGDEDPLYEEAKKIIIEAKKASASFLQRRLRIGYARAARLLDILEERGVVGPGEGAKPREVFSKENDSQITNEENWHKV